QIVKFSVALEKILGTDRGVHHFGGRDKTLLQSSAVCGRAYETYSDEELSFRYLSKKPEISLGFSPIYNLCPTQDSPVLRVLSGERRLDWMRWQLVPSTEPTFTTTLYTLNARSEGIFQSRLYRDLIFRKRCIVPLSGFFEWKRSENVKRPFKIFR